MGHPRTLRGFTLIELMITIAIVAILAAIAIPAYMGYVEEAKLTKLRTGIDSMRVFLEDYRLENGAYVAAQWLADGSVTTLNTLYDWTPDGDTKSNYTVTINADGSSYDILAVEAFGGATWVRCDDRMTTCCYSNINAPAAPPAACP